MRFVQETCYRLHLTLTRLLKRVKTLPAGFESFNEIRPITLQHTTTFLFNGMKLFFCISEKLTMV